MIFYSYYDQLNLVDATRPIYQSDLSIGSINLTFSQEENISIEFNVSLNLTVSEAETGNTDNVIDSSNGTIPLKVRDTLWIVIPISIIYSTIFVIGVLGNIITCIVIARNKSMHTATNYYLFSLAISDLLLLITGVPQDIYHVWYRFPYPFGSGVCKIVSFASETFANATVLTITAFTVERYVAICKPFLSHTMSKLSRAVRFVLTIWVIAFSLAIPQALSMQIDTQFRMCTVRHEQTKHLFFISTVVVFVCPMSVITILYMLIWLQLRRSKLECSTQVAVVIAFFLCWAPFHAQRLMAVYANDYNQNAAIRRGFEILTCLSGILYYISTCINPVLYNIMSHKFREAFKECIGALKFK
uniref:G_PROTEIN_RECEP_F1_2 domain-containing protein n=1 Tax=Anopheles funestus TaxID=62324 RepID=A0A182RPJ2_ANOFN